MMMRRNRYGLLMTVSGSALLTTAVLVGCFQSLDPTAATDPPPTTTSGGGEDGGGGNTTCPQGEVCSAPGATQCALDSPQCFYLCGSPLCALGPDPNNLDGGAPIPQATGVPPIFLADGSTTTDPCVQIEAESLAIRQQSCAPCHTATPRALCSCGLNNVMDDGFLVSTTTTNFLVDGGPGLYVDPGNPGSSVIYERIANGTMPPPPSTASGILGSTSTAFANLIYPTPADLSVLGEWILNCVQGTDGGAHDSNYYGGTLGGTTCFGPCGDAATPPDGGL
jgi:hypothetical protein